jgi:hypothetical protein
MNYSWIKMNRESSEKFTYTPDISYKD